jgi:hypothetical protein
MLRPYVRFRGIAEVDRRALLADHDANDPNQDRASPVFPGVTIYARISIGRMPPRIRVKPPPQLGTPMRVKAAQFWGSWCLVQ